MSLTLIANADVYAPLPLGRRFLLCAGGRIIWIGEDRPSLPSNLGCEVVDVEGRRLVPGLIDGHAHITGGGGEAGYGSNVPPLQAGAFLRSGVTSVVGLLGTDDLTHSTGELVHRAHALRAAGMGAWCYCGGYHLPPATLTGSVRSDIVHVDPIIGFGELAISDHRSSQPTFDEFLRIASEVHVAGVMTHKAGVLHLHLGDGPRGLDFVRRAIHETELPARTFHPTHVNRRRALLEEALDLTRSGVTIDLTAAPETGHEDTEGPEADLPASVALEEIFRDGVDHRRWTVSSDGGGCLPHFDARGELVDFSIGQPDSLIALLAKMLSRGHALENLLPGFTENVATQLRLKGRGRIEAGAHADLVVLEDETAFIRDVWAQGRRVVAEGRAQFHDPF